MGLIWSMVQDPGQRKGRRIIKQDVTTPQKVEISALDGFVNEEKVLDPKAKPIALAVSDRLYMAPGVRRTEVRHGRLKGTLFMPEGKLYTCVSYERIIPLII